MKKLLSITKNIKTIGIVLGFPAMLAVFYQLHIERTEALKDNITLLEKQLDLVKENNSITRYDNAFNLIESQKKLYHQEVDNIKQNAMRAQKELTYLLNSNDDEIIRLQKINIALQSLQAIDNSVKTQENLFMFKTGAVLRKIFGSSMTISFPEPTEETLKGAKTKN